ncbi:MAG: Asp23/Gls24 family envelope stress response protein [Erysipelotrichaceae bacterium]|nr:Asp23/Gls24 family envelope stress response protein [Erysipelotrichaceae bacterium]MDD3923678.1 Asp23/Gls24 family envelope stress response protein [Erysipelotrichaceae bacterium]MDD4642197.1 Asp23/Gls24 family envelope stress response protein [Erysipelotrichaceae bacterium]
MPIERNTNLGNINISEDAIATLAGGIVAECYGVVGMASQKLLKDGLAELLKRENYSKGIIVRKIDEKYELDLFIVISFGVKISEVVTEVQKKVKYELERSLDIAFNAVNVYVQGIKINE